MRLRCAIVREQRETTSKINDAEQSEKKGVVIAIFTKFLGKNC